MQDAMSLAEPQPAVPKTKLRWYQFSLRTLLVFVTLCAIVCSCLAVMMQEAKREREIAAVIQKSGLVAVWTDDFDSSGPTWLRSLLGAHFFGHVYAGYYEGGQVNDVGPENLKGLQLVELFLAGTNVTDAGLENLKSMSELRALYLDRTKVTDAGLENLKELNQLHGLWLAGTQVTDAGVKKLQQALPNCKIWHYTIGDNRLP
jgi:hypothetical protein